MEIKNGNILDVEDGFIIHQVNNLGVMGSGVALAVRRVYPSHYEDYKSFIGNKGEDGVLGDLVISEVTESLTVIGMFSQKGVKSLFNKCPTREEYFRSCLEKIKKLYEKNPNRRFYMPYLIGCVRGGGDWEIISAMIEEICPFITFIRYC